MAINPSNPWPQTSAKNAMPEPTTPCEKTNRGWAYRPITFPSVSGVCPEVGQQRLEPFVKQVEDDVDGWERSRQRLNLQRSAGLIAGQQFSSVLIFSLLAFMFGLFNDALKFDPARWLEADVFIEVPLGVGILV